MAEKNVWVNSNFFSYGSIGDRLTGMRQSEIYQGSAQKILNFEITELGTLKVAKQFLKKTDFFPENVLFINDTEEEFLIIVMDTLISTYNKKTMVQLHSLAHNMNLDYLTNHNFFDNTFWIQDTTGGKWFSIIKNGTIQMATPVQNLKFPVKDKKITPLNIYKVGHVGSDLRLGLLGSIKEPRITTDASGIAKLTDTNMIINRFYTDFKTIPTLDDFNTGTDSKNLKDGDVIAIFQNFKKDEDGHTIIIGNSKIVLTDKDTDAIGGEYYKHITPNLNGVMKYGEIIDFTLDIIDQIIFQNRLVIATKDTIYFSQAYDKFNFENGIDTIDSFYIKPSVINNNQPNIIKLDSSLGIWAITDRGIYSIGHNIGMSPRTSVSATKIASDISSSKNTAMIDEILYYIDQTGKLRSAQAVYTTGAISFVKSVVEKYNTENIIKFISILEVNGEKKLMCATDINEILIYDNLDGNLFRNVSLGLNYKGNLKGLKDGMIVGRDNYVRSSENYSECTLILNPPFLQAKDGNIITNDLNSKIKDFIINILNKEDLNHIKSIKNLYICGKKINNLSNYTKDRFSLYKTNAELPPMDGIEIKIETNKNDGVCEIRLISYKIGVHSSV